MEIIMSFKDIYSEVKKRKMEALNKKDVVKAVEKHGKILAISGKFEKPKKVIQHMYASVKRVIRPNDVLRTDFNQYDLILVGCPGKEIPTMAHSKIKDFVLNGGWLLTTDWAVHHIIENIFPGFIRWNQIKTSDTVVACQILEPNHPFLDGVLGEIQQSKWAKQASANTGKKEFRWWLEFRSFPIQILNPDTVRILIASNELKQKWGESPVLVYFNYGNKGGRIIHMISHTHLQKGGAKGKYASALILTNILDERISQKMGISKTPTPRYVPDGDTQQQYPQQPLEDQWVMPPQQNNYVTPSTSTSGVGLSGTSQIIEANDSNFSFASKCVYCGYDFADFSSKIYLCKECGAPYHDNCLNMQINEGTCKKCNRILLW
jgi:hypothetical protein